mmetsp:Transcript_6626/g.23400  ORF Transcript_6626/g.23400 Transcript_6626/m.23400 type:complete len:588 (+) Transcript_6626:44-1807(+)
MIALGAAHPTSPPLTPTRFVLQTMILPTPDGSDGSPGVLGCVPTDVDLAGGNRSCTVNCSIPARRRRLQHEGVAGLDNGAVAGVQRLLCPVCPHHPVLPYLPWLPAIHAVWRHLAVVAEDDDFHLLVEGDAPLHSAAAHVASLAAGALADRERLDADGVSELNDLRVREARVSHVRMYTIRAVEVRTRTGAPAHGLVVLVAFVAKRHVVHSPLSTGHNAERAIQRVRHHLRRFYVARNHGGGRDWVQHASLGDDDVQSLEASLVHGNVVVHQGAEHIHHRRAAHGARRVEVVGKLRGSACEVDHGRARRLIDRDLDRDPGTAVGLICELTWLQRVYGAPHGLLRIVLHVAHVRLRGWQGELIDHLAQLRYPLVVARNLRPDVGEVCIRVACRVWPGSEQLAELLLAEGALVHELEVVDEHSLLINRFGLGRHGSGRDTADVALVPAGPDVEYDLTPCVIEYGRHHSHVREMRPAVVWVVEHVYIARLDGALVVVDHCADGFSHGAQVHRHVRCVGNELPFGVEYGAREVKALFHVDAERRVLKGEAHLLRDAHEEVVENLEVDGVTRRTDGHLALQGHDALDHQAAR